MAIQGIRKQGRARERQRAQSEMIESMLARIDALEQEVKSLKKGKKAGEENE